MASVPSANIKGPQGTVGATPNLTIGNVETLAAGLPATARITGTATNPVLNLGIPKGADGTDGDGSSGSAGETILLGQTPLKLTADAAVLLLSSSGECNFELRSDTIADFDILEGTPVSATVSKEGNLYKLQAGSASSWYGSYIDITIPDLIVDTQYNLVIDASGGTFDTANHITTGHYILYDANGETLATRGATDGVGLYSYAFTATTTSVKLRWYPSSNTYYQAGTSVAYINRAYINRTGTTTHTDIMSLSGSFTGSTTLRSIPKGVTVESTPSCYVYSKTDAGSGGGSKPLEGKTIVCFGDSLFGMYRGDTSAPASVEEVTGATVYNVGFVAAVWQHTRQMDMLRFQCGR
jgi:hypothetical protein